MNVFFRTTTERAFTLVELLVVIAIITIISSILLANNNLFKGNTVLQNAGYDVALTVRQAQVYGISVMQRNGTSFGTPFGYGIHFVAGSSRYNLFADIVTQNGKYDAGEDVKPSPYQLSGGYTISAICVPAGSSIASCTRLSSGATIDIFFMRPEPDAYISESTDTITFDSTGAIINTASPQSSARIIITSPSGQSTSVIINQNGAVSVSRT